MRIEIAGTLATGKTTLIKAFADNGYNLVLEDLSTNRYIDLRKQNPEKYGLLCAETFVQDKLDQLTAAHNSSSDNVISDFSMAAERSYLEYYQPDETSWLRGMEDRIDECEARIGKPDLLIFLRCRPEVQLERIKRRGRDFEQAHDVTFISAINSILEQRVRDEVRAGVRVVEVNAEAVPLDWRSDDLAPLRFEEAFKLFPMKTYADQTSFARVP